MARQNPQRTRGEHIPAAIEDEARRLAKYAAITIGQGRACLKRLVDAFAPDLLDEPLELEVDSGGHLTDSGCDIAWSSVTLAIDSVLNVGDPTGNAFDLHLSAPSIDATLLANNLRFQVINIIGELTSGQTAPLGQLGTQTTANQRNVFSYTFGVQAGATLNVTMNTGGTSCTHTSNYGNAATTIGAGGPLSASNCDIAWSSTTLAIDSVPNVGDLTDIAFDLHLSTPSIDATRLSRRHRRQTRRLTLRATVVATLTATDVAMFAQDPVFGTPRIIAVNGTRNFTEVSFTHASNRNGSALEDALTQFPLSLFWDAILLLGGKRAVQLIEEQDLRVFAHRILAVEYLFDQDTPLLTLKHLAENTASFMHFLEEHRDFLVKTGLPPRCFRPCRWLYKHLGRLYDVKATGSPLPHDELFPGHDAPPYCWIQSWRKGKERKSGFTKCTYKEADLLAGMELANARRLARMRPRIFAVKLRVLDLLAKAAAKQDAAGMWAAAIAIFKETFNASDIKFLFGMDCFYFGADGRTLLGGGVDPKRASGGLTDLLEVIGHFEEEIRIGVIHQARGAIDDSLLQVLQAPPARDVICSWEYFKAFDRPDRDALDAAADIVVTQHAAVQEFWREYRSRVAATMKNEFRIRVRIDLDPRHAQAVVPVLRYQAGILEGQCARGEPINVSSPPPKRREPEEKNRFYFNGKQWRAAFEGEEILLGKLKGFFYIQLLLASPDKSFSPKEMRHEYNRFFSASTKSRSLPDVEGERVLDAALDSGTRDLGDMIDNVSVETFSRWFDETDQEIANAERSGDSAAVERLKMQKAKVEQHLLQSTSPDGKPRKLARRAKQDHDQVCNLIDRAVEDIKSTSPNFYRHLTSFLKTSDSCSYRPEKPMDWATVNNL